MTMPSSNAEGVPFSHHQPLNWVECDRLERMIADDLLSLPACGQKHKDIQQGKNRAPNTIAAMLTDAFRKERNVSKVTRLAQTILTYFAPTSCRELRETALGRDSGRGRCE